MDKDVETNLNGINTLTKKMHEVKEELDEIRKDLKAIRIAETNENISRLDKTTKINANRIARLRENGFDARIKGLDKGLQSLLSVIDSVTKLSKRGQDELDQQDKTISEIIDRLKEMTVSLEENKINTEWVDGKTQSNLGVIEAVLEDTGKQGVILDVVKAGLADTDEVIKGCIIGIDRNTTNVETAQDGVTSLAVLVMENDSEIKENTKNININLEKTSLVSSQTRANSKSIETISSR